MKVPSVTPASMDAMEPTAVMDFLDLMVQRENVDQKDLVCRLILIGLSREHSP